MGSLFLMPVTERQESHQYSVPLLDVQSRRRNDLNPHRHSSLDNAYIHHAAGRKEAKRIVKIPEKLDDEGKIRLKAGQMGVKVEDSGRSNLNQGLGPSVHNYGQQGQDSNYTVNHPSSSRNLVKKHSSASPAHPLRSPASLPRIDCSTSLDFVFNTYLLHAEQTSLIADTTTSSSSSSSYSSPQHDFCSSSPCLPTTAEGSSFSSENDTPPHLPNRNTFGPVKDDNVTIKSYSTSIYDLNEMLTHMNVGDKCGKIPRPVSVGSSRIGVPVIPHVSDDDIAGKTSRHRRRTLIVGSPNFHNEGYSPYHTRPAPLPPHLRPIPPRSTSIRSSSLNIPRDSICDQKRTIKIPEQSTGLGTLWRRLSGSGRSTPKRDSSYSDVSLLLANKEDTDELVEGKVGKRGSMMRALSWRKVIVREVEVLGQVDTTEREIIVSTSESSQIPIFPPRISSLASSSRTNSELSFETNSPSTPPTPIPLRDSSLPPPPNRIPFSVISPHNRHCSAPPDPRSDHSPGASDAERKRRFRRTLVNVVDDADFQQLVHDADSLGMLDYNASIRGRNCVEEELVGLALTTDELLPALPVENVEGPEQYTVQAWFSTRELVQGERRYSRILARGISIARSVAERNGVTSNCAPPDLGLPTPPSSSYSPTSTSPPKRSTRTLISTPPSTSQSRLLFPTYSNSFYTLPTHSSLPTLNPQYVDSLEITLKRLPRLLALSLTLSSRFAHDPSPVQIASAFLSMEEALVSELSGWAGEVGKLIGMGLGVMVDKEIGEMGGIYQSSIFDLANFDYLSNSTEIASLMMGTLDKGDRTSFGEVLLAPIQRAARYRLLFRSLMGKMPVGRGRDKVQEALWASERVLEGVDKGQEFDMEGLRRNSAGGDEDVGLVFRRKTGLRGRRVKSMYT